MGTEAQEKKKLRSFYFTKHSGISISLADVDTNNPHGPRTANLNRINVHNTERGKGHGADLLRRILDDADADGITLYLEINPYGPLDYDALEGWYMRNGFRPFAGSMYVRKPR